MDTPSYRRPTHTHTHTDMDKKTHWPLQGIPDGRMIIDTQTRRGHPLRDTGGLHTQIKHTSPHKDMSTGHKPDKGHSIL